MLGNDRCNENNTGTQRTLGKKPVLFFFSSSLENVTNNGCFRLIVSK